MEVRGGTMTAQPHGLTSPTPCKKPLIHLKHTISYTHGSPHQDTVLHMNSGLNSIQLGSHQQINRSPSSTGNHILGQGTDPELKRQAPVSRNTFTNRENTLSGKIALWENKCINNTLCVDDISLRLGFIQ